jgi:glycosidase
MHGLFEFSYLHASEVLAPPAWVKEAVFYQIFPERFANGDRGNDPEGCEPWGGTPTPQNYFGGDLQGVLDHLDYLTGLGVNAIYFNPLFQGRTNHKYDTEDYMRVDRQFGDNALLKELVRQCHARGIRVLLDAVFNHCGERFAPFLDVKEQGRGSPYWNWFHVRQFPLEKVDGVPTYETFAFEGHMPKLNTQNPEVQAYLLRVAQYWIEEVGVDGWRLDVANEVDFGFWRSFRKVVKQAKADAYILGEMFHDSMPWLEGDLFDAAMNYPFAETVLDFITRGRLDARGLADALQRQLAWYPRQVNEVMFNLLDSHDTARLLTACRGDERKMRQAVLIQLTFLGTPCIYYGDEVGMKSGGDPGCRGCMEWDEKKQNGGLLDFYRRLIALRRSHAALRTGRLAFVQAERGSGVVVYRRADAVEQFLVVVNRSREAVTVSLPSAGEGGWREGLLGATSGGGSGGSAGTTNDITTLRIGAFGYSLL